MELRTSDRKTNISSTRVSTAVWGFAIAIVVPAVLVLPLFFHRSVDAWIGTYSRLYALGLLLAIIVPILMALGMGWWCWRRGDLRPAQIMLVSAISCTGILVIGEAILRWQHSNVFAEHEAWGRKKSLPFGYELTRNHKWFQEGDTYSTGPLGFRTHVSEPDWYRQSANSEKGGMRAFVIGGSSAFGSGMNDDETWAHKLEAALRVSSSDSVATVINAGVEGYNSTQVLFRSYLRVLTYQPTHLLYYQGFNDISPRLRIFDDIASSEDVLFSVTLADYLTRTQKGKNFYFRTVIRFKIMRWFRDRAQQSSNQGIQEGSIKVPQDILVKNGQSYIQNVQTLSDICRRRGVKMVYMTFIHDSDNINRPYVTRALRHYNQLLRDLADAEGAILVDLERAFEATLDKAPYFQEDHYHPSRKGAEYIAAQVASTLLPIL